VLQYGIALKFVKFVQHSGLWKDLPRPRVGIADDCRSVQVTGSWARANSIKDDVVPRPKFTEPAGLEFTDGGKLIVIWFKKRGLRMAHKENSTHSSPWKAMRRRLAVC
jgi:hypothetical protein